MQLAALLLCLDFVYFNLPVLLAALSGVYLSHFDIVFFDNQNKVFRVPGEHSGWNNQAFFRAKRRSCGQDEYRPAGVSVGA